MPVCGQCPWGLLLSLHPASPFSSSLSVRMVLQCPPDLKNWLSQVSGRPGHALYLPTFVKLKSSRSSKRPASGLRRGEASSPCPWTGGQTGGPAGSLVFHHLTCVTDVGPLVFGCFCAFLLQGLSGILASCIEQPCILWWLGLNCLCLLFFLYNPDFNR